MCQRVTIAMAVAAGPQLLLADEPTTGLDVTLQAQILRLISGLAQQRHMAVLLITHDLGVVAETCQRVEVMYAGEVVEKGPTEEVSIVEELPSEEKEPIEEPVEEPVEERPATKKPWWKFW